ncbi:hypothetical protein K9M74_00485 [Candidatus Woesearchaeota archaeon]|nr:hypothetical protein [Candidatus Woesearchaeota archaeon]
MRRIIFFTLYIIILLLLYVQLPERIIYEDDEGFTEVFFCQEINCSAFLVDLFEASNNTFCAFYDLDEPSIIAGIKQNNARVLLFEDNYEFDFSKQIVPVTSKGLMHNKIYSWKYYYISLSDMKYKFLNV